MNEFDIKAAEWDRNRMHRERAEVVATALAGQIPLDGKMTAMEFGAGTGLLSFLLRDKLGHVTMIDSSEGMVKILREKLTESAMTGMKVVKADLETGEFHEEKFDLIYSLMVLHHVNDVEKIVAKFSAMQEPGGYLAIADLNSEDGSFHGNGFKGHRGFDTGKLADMLERHGYGGIKHNNIYKIEKITPEGDRKNFGVFLMTAVKQ
jgi:2-polyprenyl-3-methyl-5-hydroxy-6-metoxy-1,4-benzoquinol methylase